MENGKWGNCGCARELSHPPPEKRAPSRATKAHRFAVGPTAKRWAFGHGRRGALRCTSSARKTTGVTTAQNRDRLGLLPFGPDPVGGRPLHRPRPSSATTACLREEGEL